MTGVVKQSARALLFDSERRLVLIKRTRPGQEPYWVSVGGGREADDVSVEAALRREVLEELGGRIDRVRQVLVITDDLPGGTGVQHVFVARLTSMNLADRTGAEFTEPGRGTYEVVRLPASREALAGIRLLPPSSPRSCGRTSTASSHWWRRRAEPDTRGKHSDPGTKPVVRDLGRFLLSGPGVPRHFLLRFREYSHFRGRRSPP